MMMDGDAATTLRTGQAGPLNSTILTFDSVDQFRTFRKNDGDLLRNIWLWHETLGNKAGEIKIAGICDICRKNTDFTSVSRPTPSDPDFAFRVSWWAQSKCSGCGLIYLERALTRALIDGGTPDDAIYHVGHFSHYRRWLSDHFASVTSSQFEMGREPGEIENGVRFEDLTRLSFPDGTFNAVINTEILEHIPDYHGALREMARVLKPGGRVLMTFPWLSSDHYEHRIRAELLPDGTIKHILPPEYHGDPASKEGILSFRAFGWKILDEMRNAGFRRAFCRFTFGPLHGYMTLIDPVIVGVR